MTLTYSHLLKFFIILFVSLHATTASSEEPDWISWSNNVLSQAKEKQQLILIDLTAEWCLFCKKMDQTTYKDKAVLNEIAQHYIAIKADEALYPDLARRFSHVGRPGTIILDSHGNELLAKSGYLKPQWMLWMLQAAAEQTHAFNPQTKSSISELPDG